ncbi:1235_t:CDS:2 [Funneliformis mosseae]|uniref:1235_t:CDS:1 n=1 Tax=Funneliformis mosseae TaxID=27381 RepID=A0A9N9GP83_FUNMO|nr:1235_t:CDS:2 [Funneliformis mosseae]
MKINRSRTSLSQSSKSTQINQVLQRPIDEIIVADSTLPPNVTAQKKARIYNFTNDLKIRNNLMEHMETLKQVLHDKNNKIKKLKRQAGY